MEIFIPFEIAKKLEDKGFPQHWSNDDYVIENEYEDNFEVGSHYDRCFIPEHLPTIAAPTIPQVLKWLREEKKIYVSIGVFPTFSTKNKVHFCYTIKTESDGSNMKVIESEYTYCKYSEAELNCIEYIIDNILQIKQQ